MASKSADKIRIVALAGHSHTGKTTLLEHMLAKTGAVPRAGSVEEGSTVGDFEELEKHHQHSIDLACGRLETDGALVQLLDTPGYRDFIGQFYCATVAADCVLIVVSAEDGVQPTTRKVWEVAERMNLPCMVVVNRLDRDHADFDRTLEQVREQLSTSCAAVALPDGSGSDFSSVKWLLGADAGDDGASLVESIVETDESLMERYLEGDEPSSDELRSALGQAVASRSFFPVVPTSAAKGLGVDELLSAVRDFAPPADANAPGREAWKPDAPEERFPVKSGAEDPLCARVFKVVSDPYVGKLSFVRVFSGQLSTGGSFVNPHTGKSEKIGKMVQCQGKEQTTVETAGPGEVVALLKIEALKAFDVLTADTPLAMGVPEVPTPMSSLAVQPKSKSDEKKFAESLVKLLEEDVTLASVRDRRTGELVVSGMSPLHLQILWERLKARFGVEVETREPKVPYLETITGKGDAQYRHKKQTGGAGEFAEVWLRVEPQGRGEGVEFANEVFGGAISAGFVQSAEKGIRAQMEEGLLSGCPIVDLKVTIYDGKEHPVDSKDIAFQKAGREAFKKAFSEAKPVLLEPIVNLEVTFPAEMTGDVQGDLTRRRGRVQGVEPMGSFQVLRALVPLAEIADYAGTLGSITGGQGTYVIEPAHYEPVPSHVQKQIVERHQKEAQAS